MNFVKGVFRELGRVLFDGILLAVLLYIIETGEYKTLTFAEQTYFGKMLLISTGFMLCHITRKLAFPRVNWLNDEQRSLKTLITVLYAVYIYGYAMGG